MARASQELEAASRRSTAASRASIRPDGDACSFSDEDYHNSYGKHDKSGCEGTTLGLIGLSFLAFLVVFGIVICIWQPWEQDAENRWCKTKPPAQKVQEKSGEDTVNKEKKAVNTTTPTFEKKLLLALPQQKQKQLEAQQQQELPKTHEEADMQMGADLEELKARIDEREKAMARQHKNHAAVTGRKDTVKWIGRLFWAGVVIVIVLILVGVIEFDLLSALDDALAGGTGSQSDTKSGSGSGSSKIGKILGSIVVMVVVGFVQNTYQESLDEDGRKITRDIEKNARQLQEDKKLCNVLEH